MAIPSALQPVSGTEISDYWCSEWDENDAHEEQTLCGFMHFSGGTYSLI